MILECLFEFLFEIPPFGQGLQERKLGRYRFVAAAVVRTRYPRGQAEAGRFFLL
jgi:hypothetical protein